jgi:hypothetical protein
MIKLTGWAGTKFELHLEEIIAYGRSEMITFASITITEEARRRTFGDIHRTGSHDYTVMESLAEVERQMHSHRFDKNLIEMVND